MLFKLLKYSLILGVVLLLLFLSENIGYAVQMDNRGFPMTQTPNSSFGMPSTNTPFGAPMISQPPTSNQHVEHFHSHSHSHHHQRQFYYFNYYGFPNYGYPTEDNSYYYETPNEESNNTATTSSLPTGQWISASNGEVPNKAIVYQTNNNVVNYYCRANHRYTMTYGVLVSNEGCLIQDQGSTVRLNEYEVLVSY